MAEEKKSNSAPAKAVVAVKKDDTKAGFFKRAAKWFREMKSEFKKIIWPTRQVLTNNTLISLGLMAASAVVILGLDKFGQAIVELLLKLVG